jgi:DNA-binding CsgD family transcriptional regulator
MSSHRTRILSARRLQVCRMARDGYSNSGISYLLGIADQTVRNHLRESYRLLGIQKRSQLAGALDDHEATRMALTDSRREIHLAELTYCSHCEALLEVGQSECPVCGVDLPVPKTAPKSTVTNTPT